MVSASIAAAALASGLAFWSLDKKHDHQPIVNLGYSQYRGATLKNGVDQYLGISYAAPPIGDLRYRKPANPIESPKVQDATAVSSRGKSRDCY